MRLPFLDRHEEKKRLLASLAQDHATLSCLYGRRRCGKSRLLVEVASPRDSKRSFYRIGDPFLRFWFRYVEPNRSRLQTGHLPRVEEAVARSWLAFLGGTWEDLVRDAVPKLTIAGTRWGAASRWWGTGTDRTPVEVDILAESLDAKSLLVGEVKLSGSGAVAKQASAALQRKIQHLPIFPDHRKVPVFFCLEDAPGGSTGDVVRVAGRAVLGAGRNP